MKKIRFFSLLALWLFLSCCNDIRNEFMSLHNEIDDLKSLMEQINNNIGSLQEISLAMQEQDFVTSVTPVEANGKEIGYVFKFKSGRSLTIYCGRDGRDGYTPVMGVRQHSDGQWYWTLDGEWLRNDFGQMIRANGQDGKNGEDGKDGRAGITPKLEIREGYWYISYDDGSTWTSLGKATGEPGDSMFQSIDQTTSKEFVRLILADGTELILQRYQGIAILLSQKDNILVKPGHTVEVTYEITGATLPKLSAVTQNGWCAVLKKQDERRGTILITAPDPFVEGNVTVLASEASQTTMEVLTFTESAIRVSSVTLDLTDISLWVGYSKLLTATVQPDNASDKTVHWSSDNEEIAVVNPSGLVTGKKPGTAVITATVDNKSAQCEVRVINEPEAVEVTNVILNLSELTVDEGYKFQLSAKVLPTNATNPTLTWTSLDKSIATVSSDGVVYGIKAGQTVVTATAGQKTVICQVTVAQILPAEAVDLGLSVKWASWNVGAGSVTGYGSLFAWGETSAKAEYSIDSYQFKSQEEWIEGGYVIKGDFYTKYVPQTQADKFGFKGYYDNLVTLEPSDDVAHIKWGGSWRMPTLDEMNELHKKCDWAVSTLNGVNGYRITGPNGNWIFLPATGRGSDNTPYSIGLAGYYWTSSLNTSMPYQAAGVMFDMSARSIFVTNHDRRYGEAVRPVCK